MRSISNPVFLEGKSPCVHIVCAVGAVASSRSSQHVANAAEQKAQADGGASLKDENPDYAGWLTVERTSISTPVVSCRQGDLNGLYLNHGFDRLPSFSGCPFLAEGSSPSSTNMLVYAHNMGYGNLGFTELQNCYRTDCFANIGAVTFTNANGNTTRYRPLFGLRVPK